MSDRIKACLRADFMVSPAFIIIRFDADSEDTGAAVGSAYMDMFDQSVVARVRASISRSSRIFRNRALLK